jgi:hypothetical protein
LAFAFALPFAFHVIRPLAARLYNLTLCSVCGPFSTLLEVDKLFKSVVAVAAAAVAAAAVGGGGDSGCRIV